MPIAVSISDAGRCWPWRLGAGCLILAAALLRLAYFASPWALDLAPDEAHYWDWSRQLDWSYYSKGPLVAWQIRASCLLAGPWSRALTGTDMLAVRLPAVLCGSLLLVSLYVLTVQVFRREGLALAVVAASLTLPVISAGASLMTIDAPYTCCWSWALVFGYRAALGGSRWSWPVAGLLIGLGLLAKPTMVLWLPSFALFLLTTPGQRLRLLQPGFWIMTVVAGACAAPLVIWNAQHDWVSLRHLWGQAQMHNAGLRWYGPLVFVGGQFLLLLGFWFVAWAEAMVRHRPGKGAEPAIAYLWWMSAPMFMAFLAASVKTGGGELNWPITAYLSGLVLAMYHLAEKIRGSGHRLWLVGGTCFACLAGLAGTGLIHHSSLAQPLLVHLAGPPDADHPVSLRRLDPTCRLKGWQTLAAEVDRLRGLYRSADSDPVLATSRWNLSGELAFYCQGQPTVYCLGLALGERYSQYDLWRPNPLLDPLPFLGKTFILLDCREEEMQPAFDRVEFAGVVVHKERGEPVARWTLLVGHGYRGFDLAGGKGRRY